VACFDFCLCQCINGNILCCAIPFLSGYLLDLAVCFCRYHHLNERGVVILLFRIAIARCGFNSCVEAEYILVGRYFVVERSDVFGLLLDFFYERGDC